MTRSVGELGRKKWAEGRGKQGRQQRRSRQAAGEEQPWPGQATSRRYRYARRVCNNDDDDGDADADCDSDSAVADTL